MHKMQGWSHVGMMYYVCLVAMDLTWTNTSFKLPDDYIDERPQRVDLGWWRGQNIVYSAKSTPEALETFHRQNLLWCSFCSFCSYFTHCFLQHWSGAILPKSPGDCWPEEKSLYSACVLFHPTPHSPSSDMSAVQHMPKLFVLWGKGNDNTRSLRDGWILDVNSVTWNDEYYAMIILL